MDISKGYVHGWDASIGYVDIFAIYRHILPDVSMLSPCGNQVVIGVTPDDRILSQDVSDSTRREIVKAISGNEPPASIEVEEIGVGAGLKVIMLTANRFATVVPFAWQG